jgi:ferredoxin
MGDDACAIDSILALMMHLKPEQILTNLEAFNRGIGNIELEQIEVLGEKLEDIIPKTFKLPSTSFTQAVPQPVVKVLKKMISFWPVCDHAKCIKCGKCIQACPKDVIKFDKNKKIQFDYSGCIRCFCCSETCPEAAIKVKRSMFARIIGY